MNAPAEAYFGDGDNRLCYFEWGNPAGPVILLLHATGFHARCWDQVVAELPSDHRIIAVDHRGHGRSAKPETIIDWSENARALGGLIEGLDLRDIVGAGHSMGGHCLVQLAGQMGERFKRLVLIDPVIMEPSLYEGVPPLDELDPSENPVSRRRARWDSPEQMINRLKDHPSYAVWEPDVLDDYCRYGLLARDDGDGFDLACPPFLEASIYTGSLSTNPYPMVDQISVPVTILRAPRGERRAAIDFTRSPTWPGLADRFANGTDVFMPELTHFLPMQDPRRIAGYIAGLSPDA